ncbi:MAG: hypothetical protein ACRCUC_10230 [Aestuariivirga sp.]
MADEAPIAPKTEKTVEVELLADVWLDDGTGTGGTIRVTTNTIQYDEDGRMKIDPKSLAPITVVEKRKIPASLAKSLVELGKARVPFVMPE